MTRPSLLERRLRIVTGIILAIYIVVHFFNHALGLISFEVMEAMRQRVTPFWRSGFGSALLYSSLLVHFGLALLSLYRRTTLHMPAWELAQLVLGLAIVPLIAGHIAMTWGARVLMDFDINYEYLLSIMLTDDWLVIRQLLLLLVAWCHVLIGLHFFLRLFRWYGKWKVHFYPLAILVPLLVVLSIGKIGGELGAWQRDDLAAVWFESHRERFASDSSINASIERFRDPKSPVQLLREGILLVFFILLAATLAARALRHSIRTRSSAVEIRHISGQVLKGEPGQTILEILRAHGIAHASLCGGRGRCTTCRVRIGAGGNGLDPPSPLESYALARIGAAPNVRLACQTRPTASLDITPLMPAELDVDSEWREGGVSGEEREIVALFIDLRGSSRLSERHLPYDVLFILNRFFLEMSKALKASHGHYAQFEGDGLLALFGLERGLEQGCRDALDSSREMQRRIDELNRSLRDELDRPLQVGIGIHCGQAIVGTMGPPGAPNYSAIGDCVNAAARLQLETRQNDCVLMVSDDVVFRAGADLARFRTRVIHLHGKQSSVLVYLVGNPLQIPADAG